MNTKEDESNALRQELGKANKCYNELLSDFEKLKKEKAQLRIDNALLRRGFSPAALAENERLRAALDQIMHELGVPQPGYLAPVANAYYIAEKALNGGEG